MLLDFNPPSCSTEWMEIGDFKSTCWLGNREVEVVEVGGGGAGGGWESQPVHCLVGSPLEGNLLLPPSASCEIKLANSLTLTSFWSIKQVLQF